MEVSEASLKNLINIRDLTEAEKKEFHSKGGKAGAASKRRMKTQAQILRQVMALEIEPGEAREKLEAAGLDPTWATDANVAVMRKARAGDVEALRYCRDTIGEKPRDGLEIGNLDGQPLATVDLRSLSDDQLRAMIAARQQSPEEE